MKDIYVVEKKNWLEMVIKRPFVLSQILVIRMALIIFEQSSEIPAMLSDIAPPAFEGRAHWVKSALKTRK